ncbi:S1C family serine protease [Periweissella fabalis]|uniref:S1C family serine protease n=1 Tax=Periweissella fabalis TaxID=1070421 RepID=UPI001B34DE15|nr:trypsin-like peptidase domain-containing protein [Periweissella fabalis]MCM0599672.1 trypsin-like peptidase domain-containing protein [Periweissella fabalis]
MDNQNKGRTRGIKNSSTKIVITSLVAGMLGGGLIIGGNNAYQAWQNNQDNQVLNSSSKNAGGVKVQKTSAEENNATNAFNKVSGAVVSVINLQRQNTKGNSLDAIFGADQGSKKGGSLQTASEGSGVVFKESDGVAYIVTNNHVVQGSNALQVILSNGTKLDAKIVGTDPTTDLAVIKVSAAQIKTIAKFGNSDNINVGQTALAIGSPLGTQYATSLTEGIVSAKKRTVAVINEQGQQLGTANVIQTDAAINPGNSGGPLINLAGQVIGINSMKLASDANGTSIEGIGFSIPSNEVVNIINQLIAKGSIERPALGVTLIDLANIDVNDQKNILKLPTSVQNGVVIINTLNQSPAKTAGIKKYDVIVNIDGKDIKSQADLRDVLFSHKIGDTVEFKFYRGSKLMTTNVKLTLDTTTLAKESK